MLEMAYSHAVPCAVCFIKICCYAYYGDKSSAFHTI